MGVASHLGISIDEYDARIRTFIPDYEEMLEAAAAAVPANARMILDLGTGTGALAARCLQQARKARVIGIDADQQILKLAARRLGDRATLHCASFMRAPLPACDVVVASFALHHIRSRASKRQLYGRLRASLASHGLFLNVDCYPATDGFRRSDSNWGDGLARRQRDAWMGHLRQNYSLSEAAALLKAWSKEDFYMPLEAEVMIMRNSGFSVEVLWRKGAFAVLMGIAQKGRSR